MLSTNIYAQDEKAQAVIIFDASGSMWGQIDGVNKITIAKDALKSVVNEWNPNVELGLTAYGHRKKGDCNDIESLIPVGKVDKSKIISMVKKIQPKGKTPIARSLKKVANELKFTEEKATIILISDGKESCDSDPCSVAKELEKKGIDFVTHVIGFNVDKKTDKQLECIADATGGEYFSAKNATALNDAMKKIVKKVEVVAPPKPKVKKLDHNIEVTASETEGGKWISANYSIFEYEDGKRGDHVANCWSDKKKKCSEQIPVGKYILKSTYNDFKKLTPFEIKAGKTTKVHVVMGETGIVETSASEKEGGKWIDASHYVFTDDDGKLGERVVGAGSRKKKVGHEQIPVGKYILKSTYNDFKKLTPFEIKAGKTTKVHVVMGETGIVETSASEKEGGKWIDASHYVFTDDDGKLGERVVGAGSRKKKAGHEQIPVGKYILKSTYNDFKKLTPFEIKAGKTTKIHVVFEQFIIETKCKDMSSRVNYEVYAPNGQMVYDAKKECSKPIKIILDRGDYTVEAKVGSDKLEKKFTVGGKESKLLLDMTTIKKEPTKEELIKADTPKEETPTKQKVEKPKEQENKTNNIEKVEIKGLNQKDLKEAADALNALGAMFGGVTKEQQAKAKESDKQADKEFDEMSKTLDMFSK